MVLDKRKSSFGSQLWFWFHIWLINRLYLQNATATLLQNAKKVHYKMHQLFYYKMQQFLQIATILLQNVTVLQNASVKNKRQALE